MLFSKIFIVNNSEPLGFPNIFIPNTYSLLLPVDGEILVGVVDANVATPPVNDNSKLFASILPEPEFVL